MMNSLRMVCLKSFLHNDMLFYMKISEPNSSGVDHLATLQQRRANGAFNGTNCLATHRTRSDQYQYKNYLF